MARSEATVCDSRPIEQPKDADVHLMLVLISLLGDALDLPDLP